MRLRLAFSAIVFCSLTSGCQLTWDITRNLAFEAFLCTNTAVSKVEYCHAANAVWKEYSSSHPEQASSVDFAKGFKDGYATFLEWGGSELPPPAPPKRYWRVKYQNKQGRMATALWNAGYKEGATLAKVSGARNYIVVPYNKVPSPDSPGGPPPGAVVGPILPGPGPAVPPPPPERELPPPRPNSEEALPPAKEGAGKSAKPQVRSEQLGPSEPDGGQDAEITLTDSPVAPASLGSPRAISPPGR